MNERLQKILSAYGVCSRREAERLIKEGRVAVNGETAAIGQSADPDFDEITVNGKKLAPQGGKVYIMLNKPRGFVTSMSDEKGRKTVAQLVTDAGVRVYPVGRLDMNTEGLLLLTNDGDFANKIMHPAFEKEKTYRAEVTGNVKEAVLGLRQAMEIDGYEIRPAQAEVLRVTAEGGTLNITIHEGRNRQVRKMCEECGLTVNALKRVAVDGLTLGRLGTGKWRFLTDSEVKTLLGGG